MVATVGYTKFKKGTRIVICLKDGRRLSGIFVGSGDGVVGVYAEYEGREGTILMPKKAIAFMRQDG